MNKYCLASLIMGYVGMLSTGAFADDQLLVQRYTVKIEEKKNIFDQLVQNANTPVGKAVLGAVATEFGVPPEAVGLRL
jgi:hypothetical protein